MVDTINRAVPAPYTQSTPKNISTTSVSTTAEVEKSPVIADLGKNMDLSTLSQLQQGFKGLTGRDTSFEYEVDEDTDKPVFKIVDSETKEVISQLPPEELLNFAKSIIKLLNAKVVDLFA